MHAIAAIEQGAAQALVAARLDRLSRSTLDFLTLAERARKRGWAVVVLDMGSGETLDMTTPMGEMMATVLASFAPFERRIIAQRTKDGLAAKRRAGTLKGPVGRPRQLPADVRERILELHRGGMSRNAIARLLTEEGVATAHGGKRWYDSTVRRVLESVDRAEAS